MITEPKTLPADASIRSVRAAFDDEHVHRVLLTEAGILHGTLLREDLPSLAAPTGHALAWATLQGRTIGPAEPESVAYRYLISADQRRIAVVDTDRRLLGLLCLKRDRRGFCTVADIRARASARACYAGSSLRGS